MITDKSLTKSIGKLLIGKNEESFENFQDLIISGQVDLNKDFDLANKILYTLFQRINSFTTLNDRLSYRWANFVADNWSCVDYSSFLKYVFDDGLADPRILAVLLLHGADLNEVDEKSGYTYYEEIVLLRKIGVKMIRQNPNDIDTQVAHIISDCNFRMAYHAQEGNRKSIHYFINKYLQDCQKLTEAETQPIYLLPAGKEQE